MGLFPWGIDTRSPVRTNPRKSSVPCRGPSGPRRRGRGARSANPPFRGSPAYPRTGFRRRPDPPRSRCRRAGCSNRPAPTCAGKGGKRGRARVLLDYRHTPPSPRPSRLGAPAYRAAGPQPRPLLFRRPGPARLSGLAARGPAAGALPPVRLPITSICSLPRRTPARCRGCLSRWAAAKSSTSIAPMGAPAPCGTAATSPRGPRPRPICGCASATWSLIRCAPA